MDRFHARIATGSIRLLLVLILALAALGVASAVKRAIPGGAHSNEPILAAPLVIAAPSPSTDLFLTVQITDPNAAGRPVEGTVRIVRDDVPGTLDTAASGPPEDPDRLSGISVGGANQSWVNVKYTNSPAETTRFRFKPSAQKRGYRVELRTKDDKIISSGRVYLKPERLAYPKGYTKDSYPAYPTVGGPKGVSIPGQSVPPAPVPLISNEPILKRLTPNVVSFNINTSGLTIAPSGAPVSEFYSRVVIQLASDFDPNQTTKLPGTFTIGVEGSNQPLLTSANPYQGTFSFNPGAWGRSYVIWTYRVIGGVPVKSEKPLSIQVPRGF